MVNKLLTAAGIPNRRSRFVKPPNVTYAVWMDDVTTDGADCVAPCIFTHDITIELYEYTPDDEAEMAIEATLTDAGLHWTRQERTWIEVEQLYQAIYEFSYIEKKRRN